jgi:hypothetical protein
VGHWPRRRTPTRPRRSSHGFLTTAPRVRLGRWAGTERHTRESSIRSDVDRDVQLASLVCGCARRITILRYALELTRAYQTDQPSRTASHRSQANTVVAPAVAGPTSAPP